MPAMNSADGMALSLMLQRTLESVASPAPASEHVSGAVKAVVPSGSTGASRTIVVLVLGRGSR